MRFHGFVSAQAHFMARRVALLFLSFALPFSPVEAASPVDAALSAYLDAWNGMPARLDDAVTVGFRDESALLPLDRGMFRALVEQWRNAFPDLKVTVLERFEGDQAVLLRLRFVGHPSKGDALLPVTGGGVSIDQTERLRFQQGRIASRTAEIDDWTLPLEWMFVPPAAGEFEPHRVDRVAEFGKGRFLESIALGPDGLLYLSTGMDGGISRVARDGSIQPFAHVDVGPGGLMMCLAFNSRGVLFSTVNSRDGATMGVWRFAAGGQGVRVAPLPATAVPNSLAFDGQGNVLVADSFGGVIWRVPEAGGPAQAWFRNPLLAPRPLVGRFPGANGLQRDANSIIVAVSDRSQLLRVPITSKGDPGRPSLISSTIPVDDFAVAADGTLYLTTHPFNTVVRLTRDGRQTVMAGPAQGVIGPTSAVLGDDGWLYVATDGGLYRPQPGVAPVASLVRIRLSSKSQSQRDEVRR
jgi:sugar lactone lactonase YvrE/predicted ester cyclase